MRVDWQRKEIGTMGIPLSKLSPVLLCLLRVVAGFLFWQHGVQKLLGWFGGQTVSTFSLFWFAGILETIGGPLIAIGLLTRPVAFLLAGEMFVAYLIAHLPQGFWPIRNGGVVPLLFGFTFLHLAAAGPGAMALESSSSKLPWNRWMSKFAPATLAIMRVGSAFLYWQYGAVKLGLLSNRRVRAFQLLWFAAVMEFFGGPLIALGLFTRLLAFLFSGEMAVAFWMSHAQRGQGFWPIQNGGEPAVLLCFLFLYLAAAGPGPLSLDGAFRKSSRR
jgi:putative oxidoreductase